MRRRPGASAVLVVFVASLFGSATPIAAASPEAVDDSVVVQKNAVDAELDVLANDTTDPAGTIIGVGTAGHGTVAPAGDGLSLIYTPETDFTGSDSFDYTVDNGDGQATATVTVKVNAPPVAADDPAIPACNASPGSLGGAFLVVEDWGRYPLFGNCGVTHNDTDSDGSVVDWAIESGPTHGTLEYISPAFAGYTPDADYSTIAGDQPGGQWISDTFTYRAIDNDGGISAPATYRIWVAPVNDPPVFVSTPDDLTVAEDSGAFDGDWSGLVSPGPENEQDQNVSFVITNVNLHGLASLFSAGPAFTPGGHLTFTPAANAAGIATVTLHLVDDGGLEDYGVGNQLATPPDDTSDDVTFDIIVTSVADDPVAATDTVTVDEDAGATAALVLTNDSDAEGNPLTITDKTDGTKGTVSIVDGTSVLYTPIANANGPDSFTYTVSDGTGATATGTVNVTITPVNDNPTAVADAKTVLEDAAATTILVRDNDLIAPDSGESLLITEVSDPAKGTVTISSTSRSVAYKPDANANGPDSFTYTVSDGHGGTATATVQITITPVNDRPTATADSKTVLEDAAATSIQVLANDAFAPDTGETILISGKTNGLKGTVTISPTARSVSYKPNANQSGPDTFTYTIDDGNGGTATASVSVTITPVNDPPNAVNDGVPTAVTVYLNAGPQPISVLANDTWLPDSTETLTIVAVTQGAHGTVAISGSGSGLTYTPTGSATGIDVFTYTISDGHGGTDKASVQVTTVADVSPPVATVTSITKAPIVGSPKLRLTVSWTLTEQGSGLKSQLLQRRIDTGAWVTMTVSSLSARSASFSLPTGHLYTFRVRGVDRAGNIGSFASRSLRV